MDIFKKAPKKEIISVIKYEGKQDSLVWKHTSEDLNLGSELIVHQSQEAVFFKDGKALDLFGAGRYTLETQNLPFLEKLYQKTLSKESPFHSEVYFVNLATIMAVKWGTDSKVRLFDPISGLHIEIGASGEFNLKVIDSRKLLLKLVGTTNDLDKNQILSGANGYFKAMIMTEVKTHLAQTIKSQNINILEIDEHLQTLSLSLKTKINEELCEYGLTMPEFYVVRVVTPDDDVNFRRMKQQFADRYLKVKDEEIKTDVAKATGERKAVEAEAEAMVNIIEAKGDAEAYRLKAEAEAHEMRIKGYTYSEETSRQVGLEAMQNGIVSENGGSSIVSDMAGLGVAMGAMGGAFGMAKDVVSPVFENTKTPVTLENTWNCTCGTSNISSNFCPDCGTKKNISKAWDCTCGAKNINSAFCPECGSKKAPTTWNCTCGTENIETKFCPNCGNGRV